jgi:hypothetical protein
MDKMPPKINHHLFTPMSQSPCELDVQPGSQLQFPEIGLQTPCWQSSAQMPKEIYKMAKKTPLQTNRRHKAPRSTPHRMCTLAAFQYTGHSHSPRGRWLDWRLIKTIQSLNEPSSQMPEGPGAQPELQLHAPGWRSHVPCWQPGRHTAVVEVRQRL